MRNDYPAPGDDQPANSFDEDTNPSLSMRPVQMPRRRLLTGRRMIGLLSLFIAAAVALVTVIVLVSPPEDEPAFLPTPPQEAVTSPTPETPPTQPEVAQEPTTSPDTDIPDEAEPNDAGGLPTLAPEFAASLLQTPVVPLDDNAGDVTVAQDGIDPFTIIPDRPRTDFIVHTAVQGDTINALAERYGLEPESIAWCNERRIVQVLRPGDEVRIPPVDGVCTTAVGSSRTIADYVAFYQIDDPYAVIDSQYNNMAGLNPDSVPPSGLPIFFPGGRGEEIVWTANIEVSESGGSGGQAAVSTVRFQPGDPGDCGAQPITGGSVWSNPVPSGYTITRGFTPVVHPGIDLAGTTGTPIYAANGGTVIFAGWNSFGYGNLVVLIHGPFMTVYGHLSSVNVGCGQSVASGQVIGAMGSTGNSSGPHLHFEIRVRSGNGYTPQNPAATIGF